MKLSTVAAAALLGSAIAMPSAAPKNAKVMVRTFANDDCSSTPRNVTLSYDYKTGCGHCESVAGFKSYKIHGKPAQDIQDFTFLYATAFTSYGPGPCLAATYTNSHSVDTDPHECRKAVGGKNGASYSMKLEYSGI